MLLAQSYLNMLQQQVQRQAQQQVALGQAPYSLILVEGSMGTLRQGGETCPMDTPLSQHGADLAASG
jgi:hypothetical protein